MHRKQACKALVRKSEKRAIAATDVLAALEWHGLPVRRSANLSET